MVVGRGTIVSGVAQWSCCATTVRYRAQVGMLHCYVPMSTCRAQVELSWSRSQG